MVSINLNGIITANRKGNAIIYAVSQDKNVCGSCVVYSDVYTNELMNTFKFSDSDALLIRSLYDKIDNKFPSENKIIRAWKCSRILGGIIYGNEESGFIDKFKWKDVCGLVFLPDEEEKYFIDILGYTKLEYIQLKEAIKSQHNDASTPDFPHMQISLCSRLAYKLNLDGFISNLGTFCSDEDVSYSAGWLGDSAYVDDGYNQTTSMGDDDYCADLDAENVYRYIIEGRDSITSLNLYYSDLLHSCNRAEIFLSYISFNTVKAKVFNILIDRNLQTLISSISDPALIAHYIALINDEQYHWDKIKEKYPDTYNFLMSLRDKQPHIKNYY